MDSLKLSADITDDLLATAEIELRDIILYRLRVKDLLLRNGFLEQKVLPVLFVFVKVMSALLLVIALLLVALGPGLCNSLAMDIFLILFAVVILVVFWDKQKLDKRLFAFREKLLMWAAKKRAQTMLKLAKKRAPFVADYDFRGDVITYYRVKNDKANFVWHRNIKGYCVIRERFALLFSDEKHPQPFAIILHASATELAAYLKAQGCLQLAH